MAFQGQCSVLSAVVRAWIFQTMAVVAVHLCSENLLLVLLLCYQYSSTYHTIYVSMQQNSMLLGL